MPQEIRVWEIREQKLVPVESTLASEGRTETEHLEKWIKSNPEILGDDILLIGEQVETRSGRIDFLGVDKLGNTVIIELKRDKVPREALAQAIDYASDVADWDPEKMDEVCKKWKPQVGTLMDLMANESFAFDDDSLTINQDQRLLLVGFTWDEALQRMIEWLSGRFGIQVNALLLRYVRTSSGDECLARTVMVPDSLVEDRSKQRRRFQYSDEPGDYEENVLHKRLAEYLSSTSGVPLYIREILLPLCLRVAPAPVERDTIKKEMVKQGLAKDETQAGRKLTTISRVLSFRYYDFLRQVILYEKTSGWQKDNYRLAPKCKEVVRSVLGQVQRNGK